MPANIYSPSSSGARAQLELFVSTAPALPIVAAPRPCPRCGNINLTLSSSRGPHAGELRCDVCDVHVMWASHTLVAEIHNSSTFVSGVSSFAPGTRP
jgi:hypothetical protein